MKPRGPRFCGGRGCVKLVTPPNIWLCDECTAKMGQHAVNLKKLADVLVGDPDDPTKKPN